MSILIFFRLSFSFFVIILCSNLHIIAYFVLKVFAFMIYMRSTVEKKIKKNSYFVGTSSYTY